MCKLPLFGTVVLVGLGAYVLVGLTMGPALAQPTPAIPVIDRYHGVAVVDSYRWLENGNDAKVQAWSLAQTARARVHLDALSIRPPIRARLAALITGVSPTLNRLAPRPGATFAMVDDRSKQRPMLVYLNEAGDPASLRVLLDPNELDPSGTTTIDWFVPSPDGRIVALSLSRSGTESGTLHLYDVATGQPSAESIPRVQYPTAGGSLAWTGDSTAFWYTRFPGEERPQADRNFYQQLYLHRLGTDWRNDPLVLGTDHGLPRIAEINVSNRYHRPNALASVQRGDGGEWAHFVLTVNGPVQVAAFDDKASDAVIGPDDAIYAVSRADAPNGKVLRLAPPFTEGALPRAPVIVAESQVAIMSQSLALTRTRLLVRDIVGGPTRVRIFDHAGGLQGTLPLPELAAVDEIVPLPSGEVLIGMQTYLRPFHFVRWDPAGGRTAETELAQRSPIMVDDIEVVREFAESTDGSRVPVNIVRRKDIVLDGNNPTILYGYGGYGTNETPHFITARTRLWLDAGGVYAFAIIRGGGEYGERWRTDGMLTKKQNGFDDFAVAARHLIGRRYTAAGKLALYGISGGGLLMGAMLTQHPELARAVVSEVGAYDSLRSELEPNGEFNVTELGTVKDFAQFKALYAYSPYHRVVLGAHYPAVLLTTGANDNRVDPMHSRKFAAALQAATTSGRPILLRVDGAGGHGLDNTLDEDIEGYADMMSFLFDQFGMKLP
jgi:prolyl oligopeptidase